MVDVLPTIIGDQGPTGAQPVVIFGVDGKPVLTGVSGSKVKTLTGGLL